MNIISAIKGVLGVAQNSNQGFDKKESICPRTKRNMGQLSGIAIALALVVVATQTISEKGQELLSREMPKPTRKVVRDK